MAEDILTPFFKNLFLPEYLSSFHEGVKDLTILYFTSADAAPTEIKLKPYPFMTLYDLKVMIYQHFRKEMSAHPSFQSLLIPVPEVELGNNESLKFTLDPKKLAAEYMTFDYGWTLPESNKEFNLINPFARAAGGTVDTQFVTESGRKNIPFAPRARMTVEDFMANISDEIPFVLHLFLYKDVVPGLRSELRTSEREWYGRIAPYYPDTEVNQSATSLTAAQTTRVKAFDAYVEGSLKQLNHLDELLTNDTVALLPMVVAGLKFLRLVWKEPKEETPSLETLFYQLDVTTERPFLRILPVGQTAITKLKLDGSLKIPDLSDPRLLRIWKEERSPKPDRDFLFSKLIIRRTIGAQPALYGTLRMFHDKTADFLILPPKQLRLLDPRTDLNAVGGLLNEELSDTPYAKQTPQLGEATIICAIRLPLSTKLMNSETLRKRLPAFATLFQEIPPLPGDKPLLMLRYRAVTNYAIEDRIYTFLTLLVSRTLSRGEAAMPELVVALQKEFQLTEEEAQNKVIYWLRNRGQIQLAVPETKDFILTYNTGIDIAVFAQKSYYTIHMYRVTSKQVFDRIVTAVSLLLSAKEKELRINIDGSAEAFQEVASTTSVATPGAELAPRMPIGEEVQEGPEDTAVTSEVSENGGDDIYARLMMGVSGENGEEGGEVFNLGNAINAEQENAANTRAAAAVAVAAEEEEEVLNLGNAEGEPEAEAEPERNAAPESEGEEVVGSKKKSYQGWVKSQLQAADERLFMYKTDIGGRKIKKYVTMCQATESRQPYVLNQEQFDIMRETYSGDPGVLFIVYPLEQNEPLPQEGDEVYTLLKYGTNPLKQNYYLCCQFFCTKDYIMVREKDFYSTTDRQGKPKPGESAPGKKDNGSCPFCHKLEIKVLKSPKPNESVIQKRTKKGESQRHLYVSFLKGETQHPEEFYMPCCFKEDIPLYSSDPRFEKVRGESEEKEDEEVRTVTGVPTTSYQVSMFRAHKKYIVGPEKEFLKISEIDGPQVGLLPAVLDKYFGQDPKEYVSREANKMELLPNASCFLRIGVENRNAYRYDSFFAAIAPYLDYRNNAASVKARIQEVITPRIFTFLNYGNLVLEFYDPGDPGPSREELRLWISRELQIDLNETNEDAAMRIWKSYHHFLGFLESDKPKEYRQFAQMLALPGLVASRGLVFIVLELNEKNELAVRCPPFGYNLEQYGSSDFAFLIHRTSGIWEPIFYSYNRAQTPRFPAKHQPEISFQRALEAGWPAVVKQRVNEFTRQCHGIGRGAYTSTRRIDPMTLVPLSRAIKSFDQAIGVVRDAYNHVVAITFRAREKKPGLVALPVIDDEFIASTRNIHLDWDDYTPAPLDFVVSFYNSYLSDLFPLYPGYKPKRRVKSRGTEKYVALQLANGLYVPATAPKSEEAIASMPLTYVDEMEWSLNREIYFSKDSDPSPESLLRAKESELHEIFEHLRLTFSNWFSSEAVSSEFRSQIKKIIDTKMLPLFERRKRLEVLLGSTILSWMDTETPVGEQEGSLLRVDCRLRAQALCTSKCVWRQTGEEVGRCYLHSPKQFQLGGRAVNGTRLLMLRLLEELLRFPERRQQLLTGNVTTLVSLKEAIRIGDQYILPEGSLAWQDLLRLDWIETGKESKLFYEEMSRKEAVEEGADEVVSGLKVEALPDRLKDFLGPEDPRLANLVLIAADAGESASPLAPFLVPLGTSPGDLDIEEDANSLDRDAVRRLVVKLRRPVVYIDLIFDPPEVISFALSKKQKTPIPHILILTEEGPRILSSSKKSLQDLRPDQMPAKLADLAKEATVLTE
jgi:hypothetical protein